MLQTPTLAAPSQCGSIAGVIVLLAVENIMSSGLVEEAYARIDDELNVDL